MNKLLCAQRKRMSRRYLTIDEAKSALKRGKEVEVFLGGFDKAGQKSIRWASFSLNGNCFIGKIWESLDEGSEDFLDVYSFSPASGEWDEPVEEVQASELEEVLKLLNCPSNKIVNFGVVQDEYASYLSSST